MIDIDSLVPVIGLEVHVQLATESKLFASDHNRFGSEPNDHISAVTMAHPGTLPVANKKAVEYAVKLGLALGCQLSETLSFDRKNYFYPDLPKGYQITQDHNPICKGGGLKISELFVELHKIHLEEDAGKSTHDEEGNTLIDLNRAGVPLLEIVTEPCIQNSNQAAEFLTEIRKLVRYLGVSDGNMEEGSLRCDANISLHIPGEPLGNKVEIKNMNSFRHVSKAIELEIQRQKQLLENGEEIISETRTYQPDTGKTFRMRTKEELNDYRYFPEPDVSVVSIEKTWIEDVKKQMPELPWDVKNRLIKEYKIKPKDAEILSEERAIAEFFLEVAQHTPHYQQLANWMVGPIRKTLNERKMSISELGLSGIQLADLLGMISKNELSNSSAQKVLEYLIDNNEYSTSEVAKKLNLIQEGNVSELIPVIEEVLDEFSAKVKEYHNGKKGLTGMFMGQVMRKTGGKADPKLTNKLLVEELNKRKS